MKFVERAIENAADFIAYEGRRSTDNPGELRSPRTERGGFAHRQFSGELTQAAQAAGIDLALKLIEDDYGRDLALTVARRLVVFLKRPGGQSQFSAHLAAQIADEGKIRSLKHWILDHLSLDLSLESMASRVAISVSATHSALSFRTFPSALGAQKPGASS